MQFLKNPFQSHQLVPRISSHVQLVRLIAFPWHGVVMAFQNVTIRVMKKIAPSAQQPSSNVRRGSASTHI